MCYSLEKTLGIVTLPPLKESGYRRFFIMEIAQHYGDVIIRRWQNLTGQQAVLELTDETFDDLNKTRE